MKSANKINPTTLLKLRSDYEVEIFNKQNEIKNNKVQLTINSIDKEINKYECFLIMIDLTKKSNYCGKNDTDVFKLEINNDIKAIEDKVSQRNKLQEDNSKINTYVNDLRTLFPNQSSSQYMIERYINQMVENDAIISSCDNDIDNANENIINSLGDTTRELGKNKPFNSKTIDNLEALEVIVSNKLLTSNNRMASIKSTPEYDKLQLLINYLDDIIKHKKQNDIILDNWHEFCKELSEYYDDLQD